MPYVTALLTVSGGRVRAVNKRLPSFEQGELMPTMKDGATRCWRITARQ